MKALCRRLLVLENRLGLIETAEDRRVHELVETIRQRRAARLTLEGIEYQPPEDTAELAGLSVADILRRGRERAHARALVEHQRAPAGLRLVWDLVARANAEHGFVPVLFRCRMAGTVRMLPLVAKARNPGEYSRLFAFRKLVPFHNLIIGCSVGEISSFV